MTLREAAEHFLNQAEQISTMNNQLSLQDASEVDMVKLLKCCQQLLESLSICKYSVSEILNTMADINDIDFNASGDTEYPAWIVLNALTKQVEDKMYDLSKPPFDLGI